MFSSISGYVLLFLGRSRYFQNEFQYIFYFFFRNIYLEILVGNVLLKVQVGKRIKPQSSQKCGVIQVF